MLQDFEYCTIAARNTDCIEGFLEYLGKTIAVAGNPIVHIQGADISGAQSIAWLRSETSKLTRKAEQGSTRQVDPFTAVWLKHNHLFNKFGHLVWIDELLSVQADLFDC